MANPCVENGCSTSYASGMESGEGRGTIVLKPHALMKVRGTLFNKRKSVLLKKSAY
jgi:hypothetical protein